MKAIDRLKIAGVLSIAILTIGTLFGCNGSSPTAEGPNVPPQIVSLQATPDSVIPGATAQVTCVATDGDGDKLEYHWTNLATGTLAGSGKQVYYTTDFCCGGTQGIEVTVVDPSGQSVKDTVYVEIKY